jgi:hypothetical protein
MIDPTKIRVGNFLAERDEKGNWIYKSSPQTPLKKGKAKYREQPRYKIIVEWESDLKSQYDKILKSGVTEIIKKLAEFSK